MAVTPTADGHCAPRTIVHCVRTEDRVGEIAGAAARARSGGMRPERRLRLPGRGKWTFGGDGCGERV